MPPPQVSEAGGERGPPFVRPSSGPDLGSPGTWDRRRTKRSSLDTVIPAQAGIQNRTVPRRGDPRRAWFCGVSGYGSRISAPLRPG